MLVIMKSNEDKLRQYIRNHEDEFNTEKAPDIVWDSISTEISKDKNSQHDWMYKLLGGMLIVIVVGVAGYYFGSLQKESVIEPLPVVENEILEFAALPDYNETQQYFAMQVSEVWNQIQSLAYDITLEEDLKQIDLIDAELRKELQEAEGIYKEHVLQAMIQNQQTKLDLLLNVLSELQSSKPQKSNQYETI